MADRPEPTRPDLWRGPEEWANSDAFRELLGKDAEHRYRFIMEKADQAIAEELDV